MLTEAVLVWAFGTGRSFGWVRNRRRLVIFSFFSTRLMADTSSAWEVSGTYTWNQTIKNCEYFLFKHFFWVLKRTVSMRQFFWVPKTYAAKFLNFTGSSAIKIWLDSGSGLRLYEGPDVLFVWFDSLRPINNLSVLKRRVFLGWTSTKLGLMFLLKDTTQWRRWGSNPRPFGLESSTLPLSHCAP